MRVLVVEDYPSIRIAIRDALVEHGYDVDAAATGEDGWEYVQHNSYDAMVLDILLPGIDGLELLQRLRTIESDTGVLLLTACNATADRVRGLDAGADDYLVKPFELSELLARIRALIRRTQVARARQPLLHAAGLQIDTIRRTVRRGDTTISLSPREYRLLEYLAQREGEIVSRADIWEQVYEFRSDALSNVVDVYVSYLRKKLGPPAVIHTRRGHGYTLSCPRLI
jgi:DNA-binding response OmpR family regulator